MTSKDLTKANSLDETPQDNDYKLFFESIVDIIEPLIAMTQVAVKQAEPVVDWIIRSKSQDTHQIETLLDRLLDYSLHSDEGLMLFKKLLRYYFPINPSAVASYINAYREMTDDDYPAEGAEAMENEEPTEADTEGREAL